MQISEHTGRDKTLIVITGPTGIGKSDIAIEIARRLSTEIISADSRQLYKEIPITTAAPSKADMQRVPHHFVGILNLEDYYSASIFEESALKKISEIHGSSDYAVMCGGSMMYVDAVCNGIDDIPTVPEEIRQGLMCEHAELGDDWLRAELQKLDPEYYMQVDLKNIKRVFHAVEICRAAGCPYSALRRGTRKTRPFRIIKIVLTAERDFIFDRINRRVGKMVEAGMIEEARNVYHLRHLNSLNTVGFKELFKYFDGEWDLETALSRLAKNTRVYAKKQLTWYQRDNSVKWVAVDTDKSPIEQILALI